MDLPRLWLWMLAAIIVCVAISMVIAVIKL
jgi:hypothetical protein